MKKQLLLIFIILLSFSCKKDSNQNIPDVFVDINLPLNLPAYTDLNFPSNWVYITGGSRGIIVYRASIEEFVALDRHCTFNTAARHRVSVDSTSNSSIQDYDGCNSRFTIFDGGVLQEPAVVPLKRYNTSYNDNTMVLRIFN